MGWGRFFLLGDLGQQLDLSDQRSEIENLREELYKSRITSGASGGDVKRLQAENDELRLDGRTTRGRRWRGEWRGWA
jgi:hypothetical protein